MAEGGEGEDEWREEVLGLDERQRLRVQQAQEDKGMGEVGSRVGRSG